MIVKADHPFYRLNIKELISSRYVLWMLIQRDIKLRYKQTTLGLFWVVLQPLLTALLFTAVFGRWLSSYTGESPYFLFAATGIVPWLFFVAALQRAHTCLAHDSPLITKVYFPRIYLPLSATLGAGIDLVVTLGLLLVFTGATPSLFGLLIHLLVLTAGGSLLFSALGALSRDFKHVFPFLMQLWMYATPLLYPFSLVPEKLQPLFQLNPMVGLVEAFRAVLLGAAPFPTRAYLISLLTTLLLFVGGTLLFQSQERSLADKL